ncbi:MAG TPA: hypothetical protein VGQ46_04570 [Thermoanaerobaculia bacterium]|nr:hypothetical protein [Thermoanaerobaculia bacterium]
MKPRVYLETTIISYLVGWLSRHDLYVAANQEFTRQWWSTRRYEFDLFASAVVVKEAGDGEPELAAARLKFLAEVNLLEVTHEADLLKKELPRCCASCQRRT